MGTARSFTARRKLSRRNPKSRRFSLRIKCELITRTKAKVTGIKTINLERPPAADRIHSAMSTDETTDAISHAARARSLGRFASESFKRAESPIIIADRSETGMAFQLAGA